MAEAYIALGSNLDDRQGYLDFAIKHLSDAGRVLAVSSFHETDPVGFLDQGKFLNAAARLDSAMTPSALLDFLLEIEAATGRKRSVKDGPRTLDLDLLFYEDRIIDEPGLTVPHPRLHQRLFVLIPLAEIAPNFIHPVLRKTVAQMKAELLS